MHALTITPSASSTFTLKLKIRIKIAIALVDSGSDATFISSNFVVKAQCDITEVEGVKVVAAHGNEMISAKACKNYSYLIQGHNFTSDFRLLEQKAMISFCV